MIDCHDIRRCYNALYVEIRRYIWGFNEVEAIADLEIASYETCPDITLIKTRLAKLELLIRDVMKDDEDLKKAYDAFYDAIKDETKCETKIRKVAEVIQV